VPASDRSQPARAAAPRSHAALSGRPLLRRRSVGPRGPSRTRGTTRGGEPGPFLRR
jgi:hypothetical protein